MKKDVYLIVGGVALAATLFAGAKFLYQDRSTDQPVATPQSVVVRAQASTLVKEWSPTLGAAVARVTVVEFLDPECEACRAMHPIVKSILTRYEGRVLYVVRYMPFHQNSQLAATWLEAAREQGKYWESLDALFAHQPEWAAHGAPKPELIPSILKSVGVDIAKATKAKSNPELALRVQSDRADGMSVGVNGTPTFFVNGRMLMNLGDLPLRSLIDEELEQTK